MKILKEKRKKYSLINFDPFVDVSLHPQMHFPPLQSPSQENIPTSNITLQDFSPSLEYSVTSSLHPSGSGVMPHGSFVETGAYGIFDQSRLFPNQFTHCPMLRNKTR